MYGKHWLLITLRQTIHIYIYDLIINRRVYLKREYVKFITEKKLMCASLCQVSWVLRTSLQDSLPEWNSFCESFCLDESCRTPWTQFFQRHPVFKGKNYPTTDGLLFITHESADICHFSSALQAWNIKSKGRTIRDTFIYEICY